MPLLKELKNLTQPLKILLLGSGGLSIGQAGEFDYSGTQAVKAFLEEGAEVIIVNPNIATVQTNPQKGVKVYLYPVNVHWVEKIIAKERPQAIVAGFGGQTALNCLLELGEEGVLKKYNVLNLGTSIETLRLTEDRDEFAGKMNQVGMPIPSSSACESLSTALTAAQEIGYPVIVRAAYALGGLGSGFADNDEELKALVEPALNSSPQVLVEKSLLGFKEVEYEVMRDREGNTIAICNMENFDPLGIHTGDSIVVAPSQSLSDEEFQLLRNASLEIVNSLAVIGECNVQFALNPKSLDFFVIEVNARLSRSSALASKATGYPIAYIAAKVVLGFDLLELKNPVTGITYAYFEPALDYITIKIPRWDLVKFRGVSRRLGSTMKSVGEVMAIGRTFPEALQKAVRMVTEIPEGLSFYKFQKSEIKESELSEPTDSRLYAVLSALRHGLDVAALYKLTHIDPWFLSQLKGIIQLELNLKEKSQQIIKENPTISDEQLVETIFQQLEARTFRQLKLMGFGDEQMSAILLRAKETSHDKLPGKRLQKTSLKIRELRKNLGITPVVKKIDTTAGEYPSPSNYLYLSYGGMFHDPIPEDQKEKRAILLGGGAYRVGTSVEFDWCAVSCSLKLQANNWRSIIINCNPETVSTDYNSSDRLSPLKVVNIKK